MFCHFISYVRNDAHIDVLPALQSVLIDVPDVQLRIPMKSIIRKCVKGTLHDKIVCNFIGRQCNRILFNRERIFLVFAEKLCTEKNEFQPIISIRLSLMICVYDQIVKNLNAMYNPELNYLSPEWDILQSENENLLEAILLLCPTMVRFCESKVRLSFDHVCVLHTFIGFCIHN